MEKQFKCYRQKINGKLLNRTLHEQRQYDEFIISCPDGCIEEITQIAKLEKTLKQRGNIFGNMIKKVVEYCNDNDHIVDTSEFLDLLFNSREMPSGIEVTSDFVKRCLYIANPTLDEKDNPITLHDMNTKQATEFFRKSADLLSSRITYIPDPDPNWKEKTDRT